MLWPHEDVDMLNAFYGDPRGQNGRVDAHWAAKNLVLWHPPYPLFYSDGKRTPMLHLELHVKCVEAFNAAYTDVLKHFGQAAISAKRLDVTGGTFVYRLERGGSRLSVHSWGCAIDMDPGHNPYPKRYNALPAGTRIDLDFVSIMKTHGFCWRGDGKDIDPMHFQLCRH